ncbi:MAG: hypothetical protein WC091_25635 [Sulfuricellaceae bacterium]
MTIDSDPMKLSKLEIVGALLVAVCLAMMQMRNIQWKFDSRMGDQIAAMQGIVNGLPHWRMYQSRVLGPYLTDFTRIILGIDFPEAYVISTTILLAISFFGLMWAAWDILETKLAALATAFAVFALNVMLMQGSWIYSWDYIDLIVFSALVWAIVTNRSLRVIVPILILETFNRDVILVLCCWLILDAIIGITSSSKVWPKVHFHLNLKQLLWALTLLLAGYWVIEALRSLLLVKEIGPDMFAGVAPQAGGHNVFYTLPSNLRRFFATWVMPWQGMALPINLFILGLPAIMAGVFFCKQPGLVRASILHFILYISTFAFGEIYETRVWVCFIPYLVLCSPFMLHGSLALEGHTRR